MRNFCLLYFSLHGGNFVGMKIIDTVLKFNSDTMPPKNDFIEQKIRQEGIDPIRWAIIDIDGNELTISVAGEKL